jgi:hypothetical protein
MSDDLPRPDDLDRYALYTIRNGERVRLAETSRDGIGVALTTLVGEGEFRGPLDEQTPLGILDRRDREWVVNPWAASR